MFKNIKDTINGNDVGAKILLFLCYFFIVIGLFFTCILMYSIWVKEDFPAGQLCLTLCILSSSISWIGGLIGFLFGMPRTFLQDKQKNDSSESTEKKLYDRAYGINTNLELISDWLTKILIGIGLTQVNNIKYYILKISAYIAEDIGDIAGLKTVVISIIIFSWVVGFLGVYLVTRLFLSNAIIKADIKNIDL